MHKAHFRVGGDWYDTKEWSEKARQTGILINVTYNGKPCKEIVINKFDGEQSKKLMEELINDVYRFDIAPMKLRRYVQMLDIRPEFERGINKALEEYGRMNILFFEDGFIPSWDLNLEKLVIAYGDRFIQILLTPEKGYGMPVREFMRWYKGTEKPNHDVISEWSGVPKDYLEQVYQILINLIVAFLKEETAD